MIRIAFFALLALLVAGCTKASDTDKPTENKSAAQPVLENQPGAARRDVLGKADRIHLNSFSPKDDRIFVLLRIDRLAELDLDKSADAIMAPLPDYQRVFGDLSATRAGKADTLADRFDIVMVSTSDPTLLLATTLAARVKEHSADIKTALAYQDSGVIWKKAKDKDYAEFATTERFTYSDPRVYYLPGDRWIVLAHTQELGSLLPLPTTPPTTTTPTAPWLPRVADIPAVGASRNNLLAAFEARNLGDVVQIPQLGALRLPAELGVVLDGRGNTLRLSGWLRFAEEKDAQSFAAAGNMVKRLAGAERFASSLRLYGALGAVQTLEITQIGQHITWNATVTPNDIKAMSAYAAGLARMWMGGSPTDMRDVPSSHAE